MFNKANYINAAISLRECIGYIHLYDSNLLPSLMSGEIEVPIKEKL
jgi:hypothetical protein